MAKIFGNIWDDDKDKDEETTGAVRVRQSQREEPTLRQQAGKGESLFGDIWKNVPDQDYSKSQPVEVAQPEEEKDKEKGVIRRAAEGYSDVAQDTVAISAAGLTTGGMRVLTGVPNVALRGVRAVVPRLGQGFFKGLGAITPDNGYLSSLGDKFYEDMRGTYTDWVNASEQIKATGAEMTGKAEDVFLEDVKVGGQTIEEYQQSRGEEFSVGDLKDPRFWAFDAYKTTVENAPLMVLTYGVGAKSQAALAGSSKVMQFLAGTGGATLFSTGMNASIESEGAYTNAIKAGKSEEEALLEAERVFNRNATGNLFYETVQNAMIFMPASKAVSPLWKTAMKNVGKIGVAGFLEALQERGEDAIQDQADREKFSYSDALANTPKNLTKTDVISFIMGAGMQGLGTVAQNAQQNINSDATTDIKNSLAFPIEESIKAGDVDAAAVYQNGKNGTLTREFAQGRINDVAQKLASVDPELEGQFRAAIDADNTTMQGIIDLGLEVLNSKTNTGTAGGTAVDLTGEANKELEDQINQLASILYKGEGNPPTGSEASTFIEEQIEIDPESVQNAYQSIVNNRTQFAEEARQAAAAQISQQVNTVDLNIEDGTGRIEIKQVDGGFVSRFVTDVGDTGAMPDYGYDNVYSTPEAARQAAADAMVEWAEQQRANGEFSPETQRRLEELVERGKNIKDEKLPEQEKEPAPQPQESEQEAMARVNPALYRLALKYDTPEAFVEAVAKSSNSSVKDISVENLTEWYNRVDRSKMKEPMEEKPKKKVLPSSKKKEAERGELLGKTVIYKDKEYKVAGVSDSTGGERILKITREGETAQFVSDKTVEVKESGISAERQKEADETRTKAIADEMAKKLKEEQPESETEEDNVDDAISDMVDALKERYPDGVDLYHQTSEDSKKAIYGMGFKGDKNNEVYFTLGSYDTNRSTSANNEAIVQVRLKPSDYALVNIDRGSYEGDSEAAQYRSLANAIRNDGIALDVTLLTEDADRLMVKTQPITDPLKPKQRERMDSLAAKTNEKSQQVKKAVDILYQGWANESLVTVRGKDWRVAKEGGKRNNDITAYILQKPAIAKAPETSSYNIDGEEAMLVTTNETPSESVATIAEVIEGDANPLPATEESQQAEPPVTGKQNELIVGKQIYTSNVDQLAADTEIASMSKEAFVEAAMRYYATTDDFKSLPEGDKEFARNVQESDFMILWENVYNYRGQVEAEQAPEDLATEPQDTAPPEGVARRLVPTTSKGDIKPKVGKADLKFLVQSLGGKLELPVEDNYGTKLVSYKDETSAFTLHVEALGIDPDTVNVGDTIILDSDTIKAKGTYFELEEEVGTHVAEKVQTQEQHQRSHEVVEEMAAENPVPDLPIHVSPEKDITLEEVTAANYATSFRDPARLTELERNDYVNTLTNMHEKLQKLARTPEQHEKVGDLLAQYKEKHLQLRKAVLSAKSRTASSAVVGGSGFNVRRNQKRMGTYDKRVNELLDYDEVFLKRAEKVLKGVEVEAAGGTLEYEKAQLQQMETLQASMKEANKIFRDKKLTEAEQIAKVAALDGISEQAAREASKEYMGSRGFQSFTLTNFNGKVKRQRAKVEELERREGLSEADEEIVMTVGSTQVVRNPKEDRLQILFEGKPDEAMRNKLKSNGFRWSPRNMAWQRKLTPNAERAAQKVLDTATQGDSFGLFRREEPLKKEHVELLTRWVGGSLSVLNGASKAGTRAAIKKKQVGLNRIRWAKDGTAIVYRNEGEPPRAGATNGFSVTPRRGQVPYRIKRSDALVYLNSPEFSRMQRDYGIGDQRKLLRVEDEVLVALPKNASTKPYEPKAGDSFGDFAPKTEAKSPEVERMNKQLRGLEMPELLQLARRMGGKVTVDPDKKEGRRGFHRAGQVNVSPELFADPDQALKTLAHEIGHLNDYLPEMVDARGTLPNRVAGTRKMLVKDFDGSLADQKVRGKIHKELKEASYYWRPLGENPTPKYMKYRNSGSELYADALSMLFVDPAKLESMAPTFYTTFFEYLDNKPTFKKEYFELQDLLMKGEKAVLEDRHRRITEGYLKAEELEKRKRQELEDSRSDVWFQVKRSLVDRNIRAYDIEKEARKKGAKINPDDSPVFALNEYNYLGGQIKYYLETYVQPTREVLRNAGIEWEDFGAYVQHKRVTIGDRQDLANPDLHNPETAQAGINYIKEKYGGEKMQVMELARMQFTNGLKTILTDAYNRGGIYKDSLYEKMMANPAYATFRTISHILDSEVTAQVHEQLGTATLVQNPVDVTIRKTVEVIRLMERNYTKTVVLNFIREMNAQGKLTDQVIPADTKWDKNLGWFTPVPPTNPKLKLVKVLEQGQLKGYYVEKETAEMLELKSSQEVNAVISALRWANQLPRSMFITFSPAFQSFSLQRDFRRTVKNEYAKNKNANIVTIGLELLRDYAKAAPSSYRRAIGKPDNLIQEMEREKILSITFNQILQGKDSGEASVVEGILERYGLDSGRNINHAGWKKVLAPVQKVFDFMQIMGDTIEALPKIASYTRFKRNGEITKDTADYIRRSIGNPDYFRRGDMYQYYNNVYLFSNAIKEGIRGDVEVMTDPDKEVRFRYWYATALVDILPKLVMFGAVLGAFGDDVKETLSKVSDYDKTNYDIIPLGVDENGEAHYLRIPHDENGRLFSATVWKILTAADNEKPLTRDLADVLSFVGGQLPSITPVLTAPANTVSFLQGNNPYDSFRGRQILTDDEQNAGGWYRTEPYLRWLWGELGGSTIMQLDIRNYAQEKMDLYDYVVKFPFYGGIVGRTYKQSDYGVTESLNIIGEQVEAQDARRRLEEKDLIREYSNQLKQEGANAEEIRRAFIAEVKEVRGVDQLKTADGNRLLRRLDIAALESPEYDEYIDAVQWRATNTAKLEVLKRVSEDLTDEKYSELLRILAQNKIISEPVYNTANTY